MIVVIWKVYFPNGIWLSFAIGWYEAQSFPHFSICSRKCVELQKFRAFTELFVEIRRFHTMACASWFLTSIPQLKCAQDCLKCLLSVRCNVLRPAFAFVDCHVQTHKWQPTNTASIGKLCQGCSLRPWWIRAEGSSPKRSWKKAPQRCHCFGQYHHHPSKGLEKNIDIFWHAFTVQLQRSPGSLWGFGQVEVTLQPVPCLEISGETPTDILRQNAKRLAARLWRTCGEHVVDVEEHIVLKLETFWAATWRVQRAAEEVEGNAQRWKADFSVLDFCFNFFPSWKTTQNLRERYSEGLVEGEQ